MRAGSIRGAERLDERRHARPCYAYSVRAVFALLFASSLAAGAPVATAPKDTWESLAQRHYGSAEYGKLLAEFNGKPGKKLKGGDAIELPALSDGMATLQFDPRFEGLLRKLAAAATGLAGVAPELEPFRAKTKATLPTPVLLRLGQVSSDIDNVRSAAAAVGQEVLPPNKAITSMESASKRVVDLRAGKLDPKGADVERIHKDLASAMVEIIRWYRAGFRPAK